MEYRTHVWMGDEEDAHVHDFKRLERASKEAEYREYLRKDTRGFIGEIGVMVECKRCGEQMLGRYADLKWARTHVMRGCHAK